MDTTMKLLWLNQKPITEKVMEDVMAERQRVFGLYGVQNLSTFKWVTLIGEEFGEVCKSLIDGETSEQLYTELIQTSQLCIQFAETIKTQSILKEASKKLNEVSERYGDVCLDKRFSVRSLICEAYEANKTELEILWLIWSFVDCDRDTTNGLKYFLQDFLKTLR